MLGRMINVEFSTSGKQSTSVILNLFSEASDNTRMGFFMPCFL